MEIKPAKHSGKPAHMNTQDAKSQIEKLLADDEFQRLNSMENDMWLHRAHEAAAGGYLPAEDSDSFMEKRLTCATENTHGGK